MTFLQDQVVDEVSLLIAPVADGDPDSVTVFEKVPFLAPSKPQEFHLKDVERLKGDGIRLVYAVKCKE